MGNSSTKLAEKCSLLNKNEVPIVASSFKLVSKNSERIKEDELKVSYSVNFSNQIFHYTIDSYRNFGELKWIPGYRNTLQISCSDR